MPQTPIYNEGVKRLPRAVQSLCTLTEAVVRGFSWGSQPYYGQKRSDSPRTNYGPGAVVQANSASNPR
jgi:hypothetical protein